MPSFTCFNCPSGDFSERTLEDLCPTCGRPYGFPLTEVPTQIDGYRITKELGRGFYSATYIAEWGALKRQRVLKVTPADVYRVFPHKNFEEECRKHNEIAEGSDYIVDIHDMMLDVPVAFGDTVIRCHIAVLDYVKGETLGEILEGRAEYTPRMIAQVVIDLFRILGDLEDKQVRHNDLHGGNVLIQHLKPDSRRKDAIEGSIRAVAIDLGSVMDASRSDHGKERWGDVHWIAKHLMNLSEQLLREPEQASDLDYRIASALDEVAHFLYPGGEHQRRSFRDLEGRVAEVVHQVQAPWKEPFKLRNFNDSYNAQTLASWYVPLLLVDPDDQWVRSISTKGPQVITGMRGCGKTLLLRAIEFHARAVRRQRETGAEVLDRLRADGFVGLYVSSTRLLDKMAVRNEQLHRPYTRLYLAYVVEALRALQHLDDLDETRSQVRTDHHVLLAAAVADQVDGAEELRGARSAHELERSLLRMLMTLARGQGSYDLSAHPVQAFSHLADTIRRCSTLWENGYVLFLLDDVSTRHLEEEQIQTLLSALLFSDPICAFKLSSETQTLELVLRSPGLIEKARAGRDYQVFDLGAEVNDRIKLAKGSGKRFIEEILERRAMHYSAHPVGHRPADVLGDSSLEAIARALASLPETARQRKEIYHGISALSAVCVGDIGDVINIYDLMLRRADGRGLPIPRDIQSTAYQEFCSRRLYELNRRGGELRDFALSFAKASHTLLKRSYREGEPDAAQRLRQYLKIYVRITTGDSEWQFNRLRDLVDAGVFVLTGGADSPRQKTRDSDPIHQFTLTYRKLFGLSTYIGLSERDRFELSGEDLEEWLRTPKAGEDILLRNLVPSDSASDDENGDDPSSSAEGGADPTAAVGEEVVQMGLFQINSPVAVMVSDDAGDRWILDRVPSAHAVPPDSLATAGIDHCIIGLGFERRSLNSAQRMFERVRPEFVTLVQYDEPGQGEAITRLAMEATGGNVETIPYRAFIDEAGGGCDRLGSNVLIDVTGLAKPVIFPYVREALRRNGAVWVGHTHAEEYYPLSEDINRILAAEEERDERGLLESMRDVLTGEQGPYEVDRLILSDSDESRRRLLCAFSSPKHERLLTLLDARDYDHIAIVSPGTETGRTRLADLAAQVAVRNVRSGDLHQIGSNDLPAVLQLLAEQFRRWYVQEGFNVEIGLTGSKMQAVAAAAAATTLKISECWYVRPQRFDPERFTKGTGDSVYWQLRAPGPSADLE